MDQGIPNHVKITECPRDAMQGLQDFIPTRVKADYLNLLLKVGFDVLDFGSFVSPKAIPQLQDTAAVLDLLEIGKSTTKLLAIVANERGATEACSHSQIDYLGFPFSISETFQKRNTNSGIAASFELVQRILELCGKSGKEPVVYISMAFGNPYGDPWNHDVALGWVGELQKAGVKRIALADTVGLAEADDIYGMTKAMEVEFPDLITGVHLHCRPQNWLEKVDAAYRAGCRNFDAAIRGFGGCPMAEDELVGNLATENLIQYLTNNNVKHRIDLSLFDEAVNASGPVFLAHS